MKGKIMWIIGILVILVVSIINFYPREKEVFVSGKEEQDKSSFLTMMYEISAESGEYQAVTENSWPQEGYTFNSNLSKCERGSNIYFDEESSKVIMESNHSDKCYVYFDKVPVIIDRCANKNMATCMMENYTLDDDLYYHDGNLTNGANDYSYRYSGANPNNYVCFGSNDEVCPADNLYRIIGIFDGRVKLIKNSIYTYAYWGGSNTNYDNKWANSTMNTNTLNIDFINTFSEEWKNKIGSTTWYVDGFGNGARGYNAASLYDIEVRNSTVSYDALVGLVYVSEYAFAASPENWSLPVVNYNVEDVRKNNWIFENTLQWTISRQADSTSHAFFIDGTGLVFGDTITLYSNGIKPTFTLNNNVTLLSGIGSIDNPYRIS